jgi:hypothetical protein
MFSDIYKRMSRECIYHTFTIDTIPCNRFVAQGYYNISKSHVIPKVINNGGNMSNSLYSASISGHLRIVMLFSGYVEQFFNYRDNNIITEGHVDVMKWLFKCGYPQYMIRTQGLSIKNYYLSAVESKSLQMVKLVDVYLKDCSPYRPDVDMMLVAISTNCYNIIKYTYDHVYHIQHMDMSMIEAIGLRGNMNTFRFFLRNRLVLNDENKKLLFVSAIKGNNLSIARYLLNIGIDMNIIHYTIYLHSLEYLNMVMLLHEYGYTFSTIPLNMVYDPDVLNFLIDNIGYSQDVLDSSLVKAIKRGKLNVIKVLVSKGAQLHLTDGKLITSIFTQERFNIIEYLLEAMPELNVARFADNDSLFLTLVTRRDLIARAIFKAKPHLTIADIPMSMRSDPLVVKIFNT